MGKTKAAVLIDTVICGISMSLGEHLELYTLPSSIDLLGADKVQGGVGGGG